MIKNQNKLFWWLKRRRRKSNIRKGYHSQYGQDFTAHELLGKPTSGVFMDIGANDGIKFSNSLFFEELGWEGICVEPNPTIFEKLRNARNCHCINSCVSDRDETIDFLAVDGPAHMLSGIEAFLDDRHLERIDADIARKGGSKQRIRIEALSPTTLLNRFGYSYLDFLSIDTEGCELQILKNFDFEAIPIKSISVENGSRSPEIFQYLTQRGFKLAKCVGCDEIYLAQ
jgi:FkbM family methyltransferase